MKYKVCIFLPNGTVETFDSDYVSYNEHNILCFNVDDEIHETSLQWLYWKEKNWEGK